MTAVSSPIAWQTVENAIYSWVSGALGITTIWNSPEAPQPAFPYATLSFRSGITHVGRDAVAETTDLTRAVNIKLTPTAQNNTTYTVTINGNDYQYVSDADAIVAEICAGLEAAITETDITVTDNGTDIDIVQDNGIVYNIAVSDDYDDAQMSWVNNDIGHEVYDTVSGNRQAMLHIEVYSDSFLPSASARMYAEMLVSSGNLPSYVSSLSAAGVALIRSDTYTLNRTVGANKVSFSETMFLVGLSSEVSDPDGVGYIDTVQISNDDFGWDDEEFGV